MRVPAYSYEVNGTYRPRRTGRGGHTEHRLGTGRYGPDELELNIGRGLMGA